MTRSFVEPRLRPPSQRVSGRAIAYWTVRALVGWLVLAGVETIWVATGVLHGGARVAVPVVTALVALVHLVVMPQWRYRVHRWEDTRDAVYTQAGWFNQERRIAPISRIQTVDTKRGPMEQVFGLANVTVTTASAAGPVKIHGLDRAVAERLVDHLTQQTQRTPGDAT